MEEADLPEAIPAATLVLMRERTGGAPELLVTERTGHLAFAAGALVFPGGRIDADDHRTAEQLGVDAAKVAAIRETIEETGLGPGLTPAPDDPTTDALRRGIVEEELFDLAADPMIGPQTAFRPYYLLGVDPVMWGLLASLIAGVGVSLATRPPTEELLTHVYDGVPTAAAE